MEYSFGKASPADIDPIVDIVRRREEWLAAQGIDQWKGYSAVFPREYFEAKQQEGRLFIARDGLGTIAGTIALLRDDPYWMGREHPSALYAHNLATLPGYPGAGRALLEFCAEKARKENYTRLRLDCAAGNTSLNAYYQGLGFHSVGQCSDGAYRGTLRERIL